MAQDLRYGVPQAFSTFRKRKEKLTVFVTMQTM